MGIVINLVCGVLSTAASSATCWEINVRKKKTNDGNRTGRTLPEGLGSPWWLVKLMGFVDTAKCYDVAMHLACKWERGKYIRGFTHDT